VTLYLTLLRLFILRGLAREKTRASITVLGISLGVAVIVAIRLANRSALESFRTATESVAGKTSLEIVGTTGRFDELLLRDLLWLRDYGHISPIVDGFGLFPSDPADRESGQFLQILGVDMLRDRPIRDYRLLRLTDKGERATGREFVRLLSDPDAIILTERFAKRHGLSVGDKMALIIDDRELRFSIRGLLVDEGPARALDGHLALMDIGAAQKAFQRFGRLDRLDLRLRAGTTLDEAAKRLATRLPAALKVREPSERSRQVETMISSFHFNLTALGSLALLVGLFLIYNTAMFSVVRRRREIGRLRAVGTQRKIVFALFVGEALLLGIPGILIGLFLGRVMATAAVNATASTVATFYIAEVALRSASDFSLGAVEVLLGFGVALPLTLAAAFLPAWEATRIRPAETSRGLDGLAGRGRRHRKKLVLSLGLSFLVYALSTLDPVGDLPVFGYVAVLCLVFAAALLVPVALSTACRVGERILRHVRGLQVESLLASTNLGAATPRVSISVAALAVSLAMTVAIAIMVGSFRRTVIDWLGQTMKADIYVRPVTLTSTLPAGTISREAIETIGEDPDVVDVDTLIRRDFEYDGRRITLGARSFEVLVRYGILHFKSPSGPRQHVLESAKNDRVLVSESFSLRFKKRPGDLVEISTLTGRKSFEIAAVFYDYSNNRGVVLVDHTTYRRYFAADGEREKPTDLAVFLKPDRDATEVKERLIRATSGKHRLLFRTNAGVFEGSLRIFDSTFAITYALQVIAVTVAALGVISTLITLLLERRRETAVLRFLGATVGQLRKVVVLEALLIGVVSQGLGIVVGCLLAVILIFVINVQSFGWTIQFHLPVSYLFQSTFLTLLATAVAGFYPAARAASVQAVQFVSEE